MFYTLMKKHKIPYISPIKGENLSLSRWPQRLLFKYVSKSSRHIDSSHYNIYNDISIHTSPFLTIITFFLRVCGQSTRLWEAFFLFCVLMNV